MRSSRIGVRGRLLALIAVPLLGLVAPTVMVSAAQRGNADRAEVIEARVGDLAALVTARSAFDNELLWGTIAVTFARNGLSADLGRQLYGVDVFEEARVAAPRTDQALAGLDRSLAASVAVDVAELRDNKDHEEFAYRQAEKIEQELCDAMDVVLRDIDAMGRGVEGGSELADAILAVRLSTELIEAVDYSYIEAQKAYIDLGQPPAPPAVLGGWRARDRQAAELLDTVLVPEVVGPWRAIKALPEKAAFDRMVDEVVAAGAMPAGDAGRATALVKAWFPYQERVNALKQTSAEAVSAIAARLRAEALDDLRRWAGFTGAVIAVMLGASVWFARSILDPLRRLARQARAISEGDLDGIAVPAVAPPDLAVSYRAFGDLVANLRVLEAKATALAAGDLDDVALAEPLPGALGQALARSASTLSGSLAERDRLRLRLIEQASHDPLTGLHNRAGALEALAGALARARRVRHDVGVILVDVNDFKRANDTHGHAVGDKVLRIAAKRMASTLGDGGLLARLGGDDFMVLVEDVKSVADITALAARLAGALGGPFETGSMHLTLGASVGIAFSWDGRDEADQILAWADLAVYRAKQRGPGSVEIYDRSLQDELRQRAEIEEALARGIEAEELFLQYQPVIDVATGAMVGVEALVRWDRPGHGFQPPDSFIPVAEASNLIIDLDRWVFDRAARQLDAWRSHELGDIDMAINVSGRHLQSQTLRQHVEDLLEATGVDPRRLILEITETVLVNDLVNAAAQLDEVRALGVRVAIDDFGTGYASITHLQQLPVDIIKIDRSFVAVLEQDRDRTLLSMVANLGRHLGLTIIAEGVETPEQLALIHELGCDEAQGYYMSRPLMPADLEAWATRHAISPAF